MRLEIEARQIDHQKLLVKNRIRKQLADLDEESSKKHASDNDGLSDKSDGRSRKSEQTVRSKVRSWISQQGERPGEICGDAQREASTPRKPCNQADADSRLDRYLARQTLGRDLPSFSGNVTEWPLFISTYRQTTKDCEYSGSEDVARLRKCLKGNALEAIRSLLMTTMAERIIGILEKRFGRPEHVIQALMRNAIELPKIREDKPESIMKFASAIMNLVATIEALQRPDYLLIPS